MRPDDPAAPLTDDASVDEIDQAIELALQSDDLDPRIRAAFIDARLDQRNRAKEPACQ